MNFDTPIDRSATFSVKYDERRHKFGRDAVIPLWVADMDLPTTPVIVEALRRRAAHPIYGYTIYPDAFYEAIVSWMGRHDWPVMHEWIVPIPGVVPTLELIVEALSDPGDGILVQPPVYHPFLKLGAKHGRHLLSNPLRLTKEGYRIDFKDFEAKVKRAKLFVLCSPHNPVGRAWREEELRQMADLCTRYGCLMVSDEVHADILYPPHRHIPVATLEGIGPVITLNSPGKSFNTAGLGIAYAIVPDASIRRRLAATLRRYDLTMGNPFGIEALTAAYTPAGAAWLQELLGYLATNATFIRDFLSRQIPAIRPTLLEATYLMWLDCRDLGLDDRALERFFIDRAGLGLNAGHTFGEGGSGFMRLNLATPRPVLRLAMERLKEAIQSA